MLFYSKKVLLSVLMIACILSACTSTTNENTIGTINSKVENHVTPKGNTKERVNTEVETQVEPVGTDTDNKKMEAQVDAYLLDKSFNGSILLARDGDIKISKGYGMANFEEEIPNGPDTRFRIGSVTKQFTAVIMMKLQEQGLLKMSDTLDMYIPDYPRGDEITIHNLLSHTSGIQEYLQFIDLAADPKSYMSPMEMIDIFKQKPLLFTPGSVFNYSNSNYILLGYLIEQVSKLSYEEYLNANIIKPLHMNNSGYDTNQYDEKIHATGYEGTVIQPTPSTLYLDMSIPHAAGAIYSSVDDLFLWDQALYTNTIINEQSLKTMYTPHIEVEKNIASYGYGWFVYNEPAHLVAHGGNIPGYSNTIHRNLDTKSLIIVLSNFDSHPEIEDIARGLNLILDDYPE